MKECLKMSMMFPVNSGCVIGNNIWMTSTEINGLFKTEIRKADINTSFICRLYGCTNENAWNTEKIIHINGKLYIFSRTVYQMWIYDIEKQSQKSICYCDKEFIAIKDIVYNNKEIWIISNGFSEDVIVFNVINETTEVLGGAIANCAHGISKVFINNKAIFAAGRAIKADYLVEIDIKKRKYTQRTFFGIKSYCLYVDNSSVFAVGVYMNRVVLVEVEIGDSEKIKWMEQLKGFRCIDAINQTNYQRMFLINNCLYLIPTDLLPIIKYDLVNRKETEIEWFSTIAESCIGRGFPLLRDAIFADGKIWMMPYKSGRFFLLDTNRDVISSVLVNMNSLEYLYLKESTQTVLFEKRGFLELFLRKNEHEQG